MLPHSTQLQWVIVEDELRHLSEFSHLAPSKRPFAYCPICRELVDMKLGKIRIFHFAHKRDTDCVATLAETALHLNAKFSYCRGII